MEKLFDVACTLTDVISCVPIDTATFEFGPRDYLSQFLSLISILRGGGSRYVGLLQAKIRETLPLIADSFALPMLSPILAERTIKYEESSGSSNSTPHESPQCSITTGFQYSGISTFSVSGFTSAQMAIPATMTSMMAELSPYHSQFRDTAYD